MTVTANGIHMGDGRPSEHTIKMWPSKRYVDPMKPTVEDIEIEDIAHHLSNIIRYAGGMATPESVAEHSVYVSRAVARRTTDLRVILAALLHDASEAYLGDIVRPLKHLKAFTAIRTAEDKLIAVVAQRFDLAVEHFTNPVLLEMDRDICFWEMVMMRDLAKPALGFKRARDMFLSEFFRLTGLIALADAAEE